MIITILFLYNIYEGTKIAKELDFYNLNLKVQYLSAWISLIPAILTFLVAISLENEFIQTFTPEEELVDIFNPRA